MDGGWLNDQSDGKRDRSIGGRYTPIEPDRHKDTGRPSHQTLLSHQQTREQAIPTDAAQPPTDTRTGRPTRRCSATNRHQNRPSQQMLSATNRHQNRPSHQTLISHQQTPEQTIPTDAAQPPTDTRTGHPNRCCSTTNRHQNRPSHQTLLSHQQTTEQAHSTSEHSRQKF